MYTNKRNLTLTGHPNYLAKIKIFPVNNQFFYKSSKPLLVNLFTFWLKLTKKPKTFKAVCPLEWAHPGIHGLPNTVSRPISTLDSLTFSQAGSLGLVCRFVNFYFIIFGWHIILNFVFELNLRFHCCHHFFYIIIMFCVVSLLFFWVPSVWQRPQ